MCGARSTEIAGFWPYSSSEISDAALRASPSPGVDTLRSQWPVLVVEENPSSFRSLGTTCEAGHEVVIAFLDRAGLASARIPRPT